MELYAHPFSSYCMKAFIAFYENSIPFTLRLLESEEVTAEWARRWPVKRMPILVDGEREVMESSIIIEYLQMTRGGPTRLIPEKPDVALDVRFMDRFFDNYIHTPAQTIVFDALYKYDNPKYVAAARDLMDKAYAWLNEYMKGREWASGDAFSLADCAAAPALFYADWTNPLGDEYPNVRAYRGRLNARPSFARCIEDARPYRKYFPLGAPDRD